MVKIWYNVLMQLSQTRQGELAIIANEFFWSLFPVITILSYSALPSLVSLTVSFFFSCCLFAAVILYRREWREVFYAAVWPDMIWVIAMVGVGYYIFYFWGLKYTSAGNAAIVALMETVFSYLFFNVWRKEEFKGRHIVGTLLMMAGAAIVLIPKGQSLNKGDLLILIGTMMAPIGNFFQQRVRKEVSSETILFLRSLFTIPIVGALALAFSGPIIPHEVKRALPLLLINGVVLLGFTKILWVEGIHRISVTKATAFGCVTPVLTLIFAYFFLHQKPVVWQWLALIPMALGLVMLTKSGRSSLKLGREV